MLLRPAVLPLVAELAVLVAVAADALVVVEHVPVPQSLRVITW